MASGSSRQLAGAAGPAGGRGGLPVRCYGAAGVDVVVTGWSRWRARLDRQLAWLPFDWRRRPDPLGPRRRPGARRVITDSRVCAAARALWSPHLEVDGD